MAASAGLAEAGPLGFMGSWVNQDGNTGGITRVDIRSSDGRTRLHMWGRCHPTDCDWGEVDAKSVAGTLQANWDPGFAVTEQELGVLSGGRLQVTSYTHFTDNSGRADYTKTEIFTRH